MVSQTKSHGGCPPPQTQVEKGFQNSQKSVALSSCGRGEASWSVVGGSQPHSRHNQEKLWDTIEARG